MSNVGGWHSSKRRGAEFASFLQDTASLPGAEGDAAKTLYSWIIQEVHAPLDTRSNRCSTEQISCSCDSSDSHSSICTEQVEKFLQDLQIPAERGEPYVSLKESWINMNGPGEPLSLSLSLSRARSSPRPTHPFFPFLPLFLSLAGVVSHHV